MSDKKDKATGIHSAINAMIVDGAEPVVSIQSCHAVVFLRRSIKSATSTSHRLLPPAPPIVDFSKMALRSVSYIRYKQCYTDLTSTCQSSAPFAHAVQVYYRSSCLFHHILIMCIGISHMLHLQPFAVVHLCLKFSEW